jgi:hypothetical protein
MKIALLILLVVITSCSEDKQEPIFHPFKSSTKFPDYNEVDFLKKKGFRMDVVDNKKALTKMKDGIEISFMLLNDEDLETKIVRDYLDSFDTLKADKKIEKWSGQRTAVWRSEEDSTRSTTVIFNDTTVELSLRKRKNKTYLETKFDLIHRVVKN